MMRIRRSVNGLENIAGTLEGFSFPLGVVLGAGLGYATNNENYILAAPAIGAVTTLITCLAGTYLFRK